MNQTLIQDNYQVNSYVFTGDCIHQNELILHHFNSKSLLQYVILMDKVVKNNLGNFDNMLKSNKNYSDWSRFIYFNSHTDIHQQISSLHCILPLIYRLFTLVLSRFITYFYCHKTNVIFGYLEVPEMSYVSQGKLHFLTRHVDSKEWEKPIEFLLTTTIHVGNVISNFYFQKLCVCVCFVSMHILNIKIVFI